MKSFMLFAVLLGLTSLGWAESRRDASTERLVDAGKVLRRIMDTPATGIPKEILNQAKCIAVVPHMVEGGFVLGAESGRGVATCRTADGWSAPVFFTVEGGSVGQQLGIEGMGLLRRAPWPASLAVCVQVSALTSGNRQSQLAGYE